MNEGSSFQDVSPTMFRMSVNHELHLVPYQKCLPEKQII